MNFTQWRMISLPEESALGKIAPLTWKLPPVQTFSGAFIVREVVLLHFRLCRCACFAFGTGSGARKAHTIDPRQTLCGKEMSMMNVFIA